MYTASLSPSASPAGASSCYDSARCNTLSLTMAADTLTVRCSFRRGSMIGTSRLYGQTLRFCLILIVPLQITERFRNGRADERRRC